MHEAQMHSENQMLTLTYDDENLPPFPHSLDVKHHQLFMKSLRNYLAPKRIRFFNSGEYGEPTLENNLIARPHWHTIIFGHAFTDLEAIKETKAGVIYSSSTLTKIWQKGHASIIELSVETANYVAKYCIKKVGGDLANEHYEKTNPYTGEISNIRPEFATMSRKPGIAHKWLNKYFTDIYPSDQTILKGGKQVKTPKYYDTQLEQSDPEMLKQIKDERKAFAFKHRKDATQRRLLTRELCTKAKLNDRKLQQL